MSLYVKLDANFPDDDKIIDAGLDGAGLYAMALCRAKALLSDGVLKRNQLVRLGADDALIQRLIDLGLFEPHAGDAVRIAAWLSRNKPASEITDSDRGAYLAHKRWHVDGKVGEDCKHCEAQRDAGECGDDAGRIAGPHGGAMPETEAKEEPEAEHPASTGGVTNEERSAEETARALGYLAEAKAAKTAKNGAVL